MGSVSTGDEFDVIVIGGGPAGAAAGRMLAKMGRSVAVFTHTHAASYRYIAESLPPSSRKLMAELDILSAMEAADFYQSRGNTVWWGGAAARSEPFADG